MHHQHCHQLETLQVSCCRGCNCNAVGTDNSPAQRGDIGLCYTGAAVAVDYSADGDLKSPQ
jgi:hypothetical protein